MDGRPECVEHLWRLRTVTFGEGSFSEYECERCGGVLAVGPGDVHPETV